MGFFDIFKKEKKEVLGLPEKFSNDFIVPLAKLRLEIKVGQKLKVPAGWWAVLVVKDKPQDVFEEGEWELSLAMIPKVTKVLKLDKGKVVKKGSSQNIVFQNSFKCDIYYVNKSTITNQVWQTNLVSKRVKGKKRFNVALNKKLFKNHFAPKTIEPATLSSQDRVVEALNESGISTPRTITARLPKSFRNP